MTAISEKLANFVIWGPLDDSTVLATGEAAGDLTIADLRTVLGELGDLAQLREALGLEPGERICGAVRHGIGDRPQVCLMPRHPVEEWHTGLGATWQGSAGR